jgi:hypothetical protein
MENKSEENDLTDYPLPEKFGGIGGAPRTGEARILPTSTGEDKSRKVPF